MLPVPHRPGAAALALLLSPPPCRPCTTAALPQELKDRHRDVMRELLMDMLRALAAPNLDIRKKALDIALDLVDARNIDEVGGSGWGWGWAWSGSVGRWSSGGDRTPVRGPLVC